MGNFVIIKQATPLQRPTAVAIAYSVACHCIAYCQRQSASDIFEVMAFNRNNDIIIIIVKSLL